MPAGGESEDESQDETPPSDETPPMFERRLGDPEGSLSVFWGGLLKYGPDATVCSLHQDPNCGGILVVPEAPLFLGGNLYEDDDKDEDSDADEYVADVVRKHDILDILRDCRWRPMQLEEEVCQGRWLLFQVPGKHLIQTPKAGSLRWWYSGLPDYESVLRAAGSPFAEVALVTEAIAFHKDEEASSSTSA